MTSSGFAIVKFTEEDDALGIVCQQWILNEGICLYPNVSTDERREKLLKTEAVAREDWITCTIKILHKYGNYSDARRNIKRAEETSNLEREDESQGRKRKQKNVLLPGEESEDELPQPKQPKFKEQVKRYPYPTPPPSSSCKQVEKYVLSSEEPCNSSTVLQSTGSNTNVLPSHCVRSSSSLSDSDRLILCQMQATLVDLNERISGLERKVDVLLANQVAGDVAHDKLNTNEFVVLKCLPLSSQNEFEAFEEKMKTDLFQKKLVKLLMSLGGRDVKPCVQNIMRKLMTDELAMLFSYSGKSSAKEKSKFPFCSSAICQAVHVAVTKSFSHVTEDKCKEAISLWLQQAKTRAIRREQRSVQVDTFTPVVAIAEVDDN